MDNKFSWIWFARGFTLTCLVLLGIMPLAWPKLGQAQPSDDQAESGQVTQNLGMSTINADYTSPLVISAADFSSDGADPDGFRFNSAGYVDGTDSACLKAPAYLPDGVQIFNVKAYLYDNDAASNITFRLRRVNVTTGVSDEMALQSSTGASTAIQARADTTINNSMVSYPDYAYFLTVCLDSVDQRLYAVQIYYY